MVIGGYMILFKDEVYSGRFLISTGDKNAKVFLFNQHGLSGSTDVLNLWNIEGWCTPRVTLNYSLRFICESNNVDDILSIFPFADNNVRLRVLEFSRLSIDDQISHSVNKILSVSEDVILSNINKLKQLNSYVQKVANSL